LFIQQSTHVEVTVYARHIDIALWLGQTMFVLLLAHCDFKAVSIWLILPTTFYMYLYQILNILVTIDDISIHFCSHYSIE